MDRNQWSENLKALFKVGILVDVQTNGDNWVTGYIDEVGISQHEGEILLANIPPSKGDVFKGKRIKISDIKVIKFSEQDKPSF